MVERIKSGEIASYSFGTVVPMDSSWAINYFLEEFKLVDRIVAFNTTHIEFDFGYSASYVDGGEYEHIIKFEKL